MRHEEGQLVCLHQLNAEAAYSRSHGSVLLVVHSPRCATVYGVDAYDVKAAERVRLSVQTLA
jgi:hypothetical protein